ncbi:MAG TPA: hypothetical protein PJ982_09815, partial [Lacipirellulaceae bacterium]|nr:hypothetical protein [Lacipirellulaceae bacterium]
YDQFHHDEPWDSPHNRTLIPRMPDEFRSADAQLNNAGKTRYVVPRGAGTLFSAKDVLTKANADQRTNMLMLLEAADEHAVVWTSPEDIELDPRMAAQDLMIRPPGGFLAGFVGHMQMLRQDIAPEAVAAALTGTSDNRALWQQFALPMPNTRPGGPWRQERQAELFARLRLGEVISKGLGNQIAFHVYDSDPVFDFSLAQMAGLTLGNMRGRIDDDFLMLFPLIGALNGPVYLSIPVQDRALVDGFLDRLDALLAEQAARSESLGFFRINQDFYRLPDESSHDVRAYGFGFGPLKWRFFFSRIGDALYVASKREVIADLAALADESAPRMAGGRGRGDRCDLAHGLVRLRPQHWDRVLTSYRLGWAENNRQACLQNLGPLAGLSRALAAGHEDHASVSLGDVEQYAARVYDVHHFCPDAGQYLVAGDGREVRCSLHGTMSEPRQSTAPAAGSELGDLVRQFSDMTIALTFLEDGLHATVILERANPTGQTQP